MTNEEKLLERGSITFLYRPRVEQPATNELPEVQRLLMLLSPDDASHERVIAIGRKRLAPSSGRERFWGFIDLVLDSFDMEAALGLQVYGTKTRDIRHLPAAKAFAAGSYEIAIQGGHAHLQWHLDEVASGDPVAARLPVERDGDFIVTVANPDPAAWGVNVTPDLQAELFDMLEIHVTLPAPFSPHLHRRFHGHRFAALDSTAWLDHPGAELVFLESSEQPQVQRLSAM